MIMNEYRLNPLESEFTENYGRTIGAVLFGEARSCRRVCGAEGEGIRGSDQRSVTGGQFDLSGAVAKRRPPRKAPSTKSATKISIPKF